MFNRLHCAYRDFPVGPTGCMTDCMNSTCLIHATQHPTVLVVYHRLRGSASPVLTATGFVNGKGRFSNRHRIDTPQPITKKFVTGDYVGDPYGCAKLGAYPYTGGFLAHGWNITKIIFIYAPFLRNSPTGQTRLRIFTHDSSNDADSRKDVPFLGIFHIAPHLGGQKPPKPQIFGRE